MSISILCLILGNLEHDPEGRGERENRRGSCRRKQQGKIREKGDMVDLRRSREGKGEGDTGPATINQDLDLIKSCTEVTRVAARRAAVRSLGKDGKCTENRGENQQRPSDCVFNRLGRSLFCHQLEASEVCLEGSSGWGGRFISLRRKG